MSRKTNSKSRKSSSNDWTPAVKVAFVAAVVPLGVEVVKTLPEILASLAVLAQALTG